MKSVFPVTKVTESKLKKYSFDTMPFGTIFSDHMLIADYKDGRWQAVRIEPYGPMSVQPGMCSLHYGQLIFEGLKAYKNTRGEINIFRMRDNFERMNRSAERFAMPTLPEDVFMGGLIQLIELEKAWVADLPGHSLYIRPFMFATDEYVKVRASDTYRFMIICTPVGPYYTEPIKVKVERNYIRSAPGGVGYAKCAGNYGASLYPTKLAQQQGFTQILWTDALEHKYFEESGTMNVMFVIDDVLVTPPVSDTILPGITRDTVLTLAKEMGVAVEERPVAVEEVEKALQEGRLNEAFGCGTAVTIGMISLIDFGQAAYELPEVNENALGRRLLKKLTDIRLGLSPDPHNWVYSV